MKIFIWVGVLLNIQYLECSIFNNNPCGSLKINPMPDFDFNQLMGVWYNYASTDNYDDVSVSCLKKNYYDFNSTTLSFLESFVIIDDALDIVEENLTRQIDPKRPGVIFSKKNAEGKGIFGSVSMQSVIADSVITYTDYKNVQLRVSCSNINNFWAGSQLLYYFILVRDRKFDSVKKLAPVFENLMSIGITNFDNLKFLMNNPDCPN